MGILATLRSFFSRADQVQDAHSAGRRCSRCRTPGHNIRTCPEVIEIQQEFARLKRLDEIRRDGHAQAELRDQEVRWEYWYNEAGS